jgi:hypothetical protein
MALDLPIGSYSDPPASSARLVNCYRESGGPQGISPLLGFPGISASSTVGNGPVKAGLSVHGVKYVVSGTKLYKDGSLVGSMSGSARPQIATNGIEVCVVIEPRAWVYTIATNAFAEITDVDFTARGASTVQFIDNYLSFTEPGSGRWFISDLADATAFDSLNFATAEGAPDNLVSHIVDHREAFLLGEQSCELWQNAGVSGFPFIRASNGFVEIGCLAKYSPAKVDQSIYWLASDLTVRRLQGVTARQVSTHHIERKLRTYTVASAFGQSISYDGHLFYVLTFPEATWCLDVTTQQWFELESHGLPNWRVNCAFMHGGRTYVGDSQSGKLGLLDDVFKEWDDPFVMSWTYAPTREPHSCIEIIAQMGVGLSSGQGSDPEIMLAKSDDGGQNFTEMSTRKLGVIGNRQARARWHRLGAIRKSQMRVYRGSISDPVRRKILATVLT